MFCDVRTGAAVIDGNKQRCFHSYPPDAALLAFLVTCTAFPHIWRESPQMHTKNMP
jgi:hypothetical protein